MDDLLFNHLSGPSSVQLQDIISYFEEVDAYHALEEDIDIIEC
jgi:hypothetical protein